MVAQVAFPSLSVTRSIAIYGGTEMDLSPPHTILISQTIHVVAASDTIPADDIIAAVTNSAADTMAATNTNENPDLGWPLCYMASNQFGKHFCYVARHERKVHSTTHK